MVQQMPNLSLIEHARYTGQTLQSECKSIYMHVYRAHCINFVVTSFELELEHELYFHQLSTYLQCILIMVIKCIFQMLYSIFGSSVINDINDN